MKIAEQHGKHIKHNPKKQQKQKCMEKNTMEKHCLDGLVEVGLVGRLTVERPSTDPGWRCFVVAGPLQEAESPKGLGLPSILI